MPGSAIIFYIMAANAAWWIASFLALTLNIGTIYATLSNGYFSFIVGTFSAVNLAATCRVAEDYQGEATDGNVEV